MAIERTIEYILNPDCIFFKDAGGLGRDTGNDARFAQLVSLADDDGFISEAHAPDWLKKETVGYLETNRLLRFPIKIDGVLYSGRYLQRIIIV